MWQLIDINLILLLLRQSIVDNHHLVKEIKLLLTCTNNNEIIC